MGDTASLPTGTVTFLFTDIEGSTRLWEEHPGAMRLALARHHAILTTAIEEQGGAVIKSQGEGDSLFAVFSRATDAVAAGHSLQREVIAERWPAETPLRVRVALHTGEADLCDSDYFGPAVNRCARLRAVGHGGQVLLSDATQALVRDTLPPSASLRDLGPHRLRDLQRPERVFQLLHPDLPADFPPLASLDALPNNLPLQVTSFVGREKELAEVKRLLGGTRLLTLTGTGGTGKTRLALQAVAEVLPEYPDGVWLVELAPLADPSLVPQTLAAALGVREDPARPLAQTLVDALKPKRLLLLLDNCEHLLTACAQLADTFVRACPGVQILATSREGLGIGGEQTFQVPSLALPEGRAVPPLEQLREIEAVRLFADRAVLAQPSFAITFANAEAVAQVVQRLDGIPLAIELAAARVKTLSVDKLNARLDDMFRLLRGGSRTVLPRHQTLRALIEWSYNLLTEPERAMLRRLSVFAGGWTLEASEAVCAGEGVEEGEVLELLTSLVEKSLVLYEEGGGEGRYRLLETVRQYARDRLMEAGEPETVRARHRDWFLSLAEEAEPELRGTNQVVWLERLEQENDNFRDAMQWSLMDPSRTETGLRLASSLSWFWVLHGYLGEGRKWLRTLLQQGDSASAAARARALYWAGSLAWRQGDYELARTLCEESRALFETIGDWAGIAASTSDLGTVAFEQGDYLVARSLYQRSLEVFTRLGDKVQIAFQLGGLGIVAMQDGDYASARSFHDQSLGISLELGDSRNIAKSLNNLAQIAFHQGDYVLAHRLVQESLALSQEHGDKRIISYSLYTQGCLASMEGNIPGAHCIHEDCLALRRELGDRQGIATSLNALGTIVTSQSDCDRATALFRESLSLSIPLGHRRGMAASLLGLAGAAHANHQPGRAARLLGASEALRESIHTVLSPDERCSYEYHLVAIRTALGEKASATACAEGRAMTLEDAVAYALEVPSPGDAE